MPVAVLQKKIERLPQEYIQKVNDYVELLLFKFDTTKYIAPQNEAMEALETLKSFCGTLPQNFDYKKELETALEEKYGIIN